MNNQIEVIKGDITQVKADAIVNAANSSLMGGGGVDGAIHRAGGPAILEECRKIVAKQGGCKTGEAVITTAGRLPAKYVIHTVGPVWNGGSNKEREKLANCYFNSLRLAVEHNCKTIAFPNISTGVYHFPKEEAASIAVDTIKKFLSQNTSIDKVVLVCFDEENYHYMLKRIQNDAVSDTREGDSSN
jgi:O-acetyl-ADP-ribose deacetylase